MKKILFSLLLLTLSAFASLESHQYLRAINYPRPIIPDTIHQNLPSIPEFGYAADLVVIFSLIILVEINLKNPQKITYSASLLALTHLLRSLIIILNPVGDSFTETGYHGIFPGSDLSQGMFPSGHTATVFLIYLLTEKNSPHRLSMLLLVSLEIISLLVSKGHYSIDIIGGILLAYSVYKFFESRPNFFLKN